MSNGTVTTKDYAIGGKLITASCVINPSFNLDEDQTQEYIKMKLANEIACFMVQNNLIEFTRLNNVNDFGTTVRARAYLAPNDQVKVIRTFCPK